MLLGGKVLKYPVNVKIIVIFEASTPQLFSLRNLRIDNGVRNVLHKSRERERERERPLEAAAGFGEEEEGASRHAHGQRWLL